MTNPDDGSRACGVTALQDAAYADVTAFRARDAHVVDETGTAYRAWMRPPVVKRGECVSGGAAVIEQIRAPLMPSLLRRAGHA